IGLEVGVADPHEALLAMFLRLRFELLAKPFHHAGEVGPSIAIAANPLRTLVLDPKAFRRPREKPVDVGGHFDVGGRPADLENLPALSFERAVHRYPDHFDEEVVAEEDGQEALALGDATRRLAEMSEVVTRARAERRGLE